MKTVQTRPPSFPDALRDQALEFTPGLRWQVLCGDQGHWRCGLYSPAEAGPDEIGELESHDCPELFLLVQGHLTLVLSDGNGSVRELALTPGKPVLVDAPHAGYCPDGPHTGTAFVVERDAFDTEYRPPAEWTHG